jgi:hypothetical protein
MSQNTNADLDHLIERMPDLPREGLTPDVIRELEGKPAFSELLDLIEPLLKR